MTHTEIILLVVSAMVLGAAIMMVALVLLMSHHKDIEDYKPNTYFIAYRDKNQVGLDGGEIRIYKYGELVNTISGRMADDIWKWLTTIREDGKR